MKKILKSTVLTCSILLLNSGCTKLGPDFNGVEEIDNKNSYNSQEKKNFTETTKWWESFNDTTLNSLIEHAYKQNLDIQSAGLRILQARAIIGISDGLRFPQVQRVSGGAFSNRVDGNGFGTIGASFDMGWEMDVWGKYARGIESSQALLLASIASYNDIMLSVIAEVARNYVNYKTAEERIAYAKRNIVIQEYVTQITKVQFNTGNVSELDMQQSLAQLHITKSSLPSFEQTMLQSKNALAVLMGLSPLEVEKFLNKENINDSEVSDFFNIQKNGMQINNENNKALDLSIVPFADFDTNVKIDVGILSSRPDLKVAEYQARSNSANIGLTEAELYPSFTLLGSIGLSATNVDGSWSSAGDSVNVSAGPSFTWNILLYDRIKNKIRVKDAIFEESLFQYNKKVLQAISEVSNSLNGYKYALVQESENKKAVDATVRAFNISMIQYNDGLVSYQRLLSTVENLTRNQDRYAQTKGALATNLIALYKSLGSGWKISENQNYISKDVATRMEDRTDWGNYLDTKNTKIPKVRD